MTTFLSIILIAFNKSWYNYRQINSQGPGQQKQNQRQQESVIQQDHRKVPNQIPISIKLRRQYFRRGAAQSQHQSIVPVQSNARRIQIRLGRQAIWRQEAWRPGPHQQNDRGLEEQQEAVWVKAWGLYSPLGSEGQGRAEGGGWGPGKRAQGCPAQRGGAEAGAGRAREGGDAGKWACVTQVVVQW